MLGGGAEDSRGDYGTNLGGYCCAAKLLDVCKRLAYLGNLEVVASTTAEMA